MVMPAKKPASPELVNIFVFILFSIFLLAIVGGLITSSILKNPGEFALQYNPYAILSGLATVVNLIIAGLIVTIGVKSEDVSWFLFYFLAAIIYGLGEFLQRTSASPVGALFWEHISGIGIALLPAAIYLFVTSFTRRTRERPIWVVPGLAITWTFVSFFYANGAIDYYGHVTRYPWGYYTNTQPEPGYLLLLIWGGVLFITSLVILVRFRQKIPDKTLKKQALLYLLAIAVPFSVSFITDGLLPSLGINSLPPLGIFFTTLSGIILFYGVRHYRLFRLNPQLLAENILNTIDEAVIVTRTDFKIERVNHAATELLAKAEEALINTSLIPFFPTESWEKVNYHITDKHESYKVGELTLASAAGSFIPVRVFRSGLEDNGRTVAYTFVISDITDITNSYHSLERLEEQLKRENITIEKTVEVRTKELQLAQERLKAADRMKTEFIILTSHNLRTPLSIAQNNTELLDGASLSDVQKQYIVGIQNGLKRLSQFVENLLAISSIEAGERLVLEQISVDGLLQPLVEEARAQATSKGLVLNVVLEAKDVELRAAVLSLRDAIRNVLENAFKFTSQGSVSLSTQVTDGMLTIKVADTGVGIAPEEMPNLFTKFHRATDTLQYNYEGEGIGLFLAKLVIEQHGGSIQVESQLGRGTTLQILLPIFMPTASK